MATSGGGSYSSREKGSRRRTTSSERKILFLNYFLVIARSKTYQKKWLSFFIAITRKQERLVRPLELEVESFWAWSLFPLILIPVFVLVGPKWSR